MSISLARKEVTSGARSGMVLVFYLFTFLTGGFFLFAGGRLGFAADLAATVLYIAVTVLFYALNRRT